MSDPCANPPGQEALSPSAGAFRSPGAASERPLLVSSSFGANVSSRMVQAESTDISANATTIGRMDHLHVPPVSTHINARRSRGFRELFPPCSLRLPSVCPLPLHSALASQLPFPVKGCPDDRMQIIQSRRPQESLAQPGDVGHQRRRVSRAPGGPPQIKPAPGVVLDLR